MYIDVPQILIRAQEFQKFKQYDISRKLYYEFFTLNSNHPLRFKALFEIAENYFYEKNYKMALRAYLDYEQYCNSHITLSTEEELWIKGYKKLLETRFNEIERISQM